MSSVIDRSSALPEWSSMIGPLPPSPTDRRSVASTAALPRSSGRLTAGECSPARRIWCVFDTPRPVRVPGVLDAMCLGFCKQKKVRLALAHARRSSARHLESRTVLRPRPAVIVDPRGGDVGVAKPFLHRGDVGFVVERISGGGRAQRMGADLEASWAE